MLRFSTFALKIVEKWKTRCECGKPRKRAGRETLKSGEINLASFLAFCIMKISTKATNGRKQAMNESTELEKARVEIKALHEAIDALSYRYAEEVASNAVDCANAVANARFDLGNAGFAATWLGVLDGLTPRDVENAVKLARSEYVFNELAYCVRVFGDYIEGDGGICEYASELMRGAEVFEECGIDRDWFMEFNAERIRERYERERAECEAAEAEGVE